MKKLAASLIVGISLLVALGLKSRMFSRKTDTPPQAPSPQRLASRLTEAEERDLQGLVPLALRSIKEWFQPINCLDQDKLLKTNFGKIIKDHEGQEIELRLDVRENTLIVIFDALHMYLVFPRLHDLGLAPPEYELFCEISYEETIASQKKRDRYFESSKKDVRGDPRLTAIVHKINERYPSADYDRASREGIRKYLVPSLPVKAVQPFAKWGEDKKHLYERILEVARHEALFHCQPNKPVTMIVPDFEIGDPQIYLLFEPPATRTSIEWITLSRDVSSGQYTAEHAKNFGLPDEIRTFSPTIRARQVKQVSVECPSK